MTLGLKADRHFELLARLPGDKRFRLGTGGSARPALAGFDPWFAILREAVFVDFVGRLSLSRQAPVRPVFIVPIGDSVQLATKRLAAKRNRW